MQMVADLRVSVDHREGAAQEQERDWAACAASDQERVHTRAQDVVEREQARDPKPGVVQKVAMRLALPSAVEHGKGPDEVGHLHQDPEQPRVQARAALGRGGVPPVVGPDALQRVGDDVDWDPDVVEGHPGHDPVGLGPGGHVAGEALEHDDARERVSGEVSRSESISFVQPYKK
jgi:hypothetical protein